MRKVLIIAYYFPPSGGPGVQRVLKFVQYLRDFGWEPVVLTVKDGTFPARDESLLEEIPEGVAIFRTDIFEPYELYRRFTGARKIDGVDVNNLKSADAGRSLTERVSEFIRATFFIPDARIGWRRHAVREGLRIIREEGIDAIYSSSPPYTCSLIARDLRRKSNVPWVAGFRDPWTGFLTTPDRWLIPAKIDRSLERSVFSEADAVDVAWTGIRDDALGKYPELSPDRFHHLPNGFDSNDFPDVSAKDRTDRRFTITYTGSMYGVRTPREFLEAVARLLDSGDIPPEDIRLRFIGRFGEEVHEMFRSFAYPGLIDVEGYMPHAESIRQLLLSDALLLVVDTTGDSAEIVPGKVYEYIGTGLPVIAVAPESGAIAELMRETGAGLVAHQTNVDGIAANILAVYRHRTGQESPVRPDREAIARYERRNVTGELAQLLDSVCAEASGREQGTDTRIREANHA